MDFTLHKYEELLQSIVNNNIPVYNVERWAEEKPTFGILIRHDVDRMPKNALKMALLEHKYNISSTYYFRIIRSVFKPSIIKKIAKLNHKIGYHYEDLSLAKGNMTKALSFFNEHLNNLRKHTNIETIAMHGRPFSPHDNRDLWENNSFEKYGIKADAFLSIDYSETFYFTDTGRSWVENSINLRDTVKSKSYKNVSCTKDLISFIANKQKAKIAITVHPERWNNKAIKWLFYFILDTTVNIIKTIIREFRK